MLPPRIRSQPVATKAHHDGRPHARAHRLAAFAAFRARAGRRTRARAL